MAVKSRAAAKNTTGANKIGFLQRPRLKTSLRIGFMAKTCQTYFGIAAPENRPTLRLRSIRRACFRYRASLALFTLLSLSTLHSGIAFAQSHDVVCRDGDGGFEAESAAGVKVRVGPAMEGGLAARVCAASLAWSDQKLEIAAEASQLDVDAFGVDLGLGAPVAAIQIKRSKTECCVEYEIYSLRLPPVLRKRITGGDFFSVADTDLDGRVEIWTDDAAAVDGFEGLRLRELDFAPPVILRFTRGRLLDASAEFQAYFDQKMSEERAKLNANDLADFKASDGKLSADSGISASQRSRLRSAKMHALEIVWSFLYSGREKEAWRALADMWPAADLDRIHAAIVSAKARGIRSQLEGVSTPVRPGRENHVKIFDGTTYVASTPGLTPKNVNPKQEIVPPRAILMERQPPMTALEMELSQTESTLELVIDSAGKVRSVEQFGKVQGVDEGLLKSTSNWKFIPAFDKGEPVASKILLGVSLRK